MDCYLLNQVRPFLSVLMYFFLLFTQFRGNERRTSFRLNCSMVSSSVEFSDREEICPKSEEENEKVYLKTRERERERARKESTRARGREGERENLNPIKALKSLFQRQRKSVCQLFPLFIPELLFEGLENLGEFDM